MRGFTIAIKFKDKEKDYSTLLSLLEPMSKNKDLFEALPHFLGTKKNEDNKLLNTLLNTDLGQVDIYKERTVVYLTGWFDPPEGCEEGVIRGINNLEHLVNELCLKIFKDPGLDIQRVT